MTIFITLSFSSSSLSKFKGFKGFSDIFVFLVCYTLSTYIKYFN